MKTLIFNGSPRKNGGTAAMIDALQSRLTGETTVIRSYSADISPCIDCRACWTRDRCALDDSMQDVYRLIDEADIIVIASPIYFGELTGSLLNLMSRLQYYWAARRMRGAEPLSQRSRCGALLLVDGGEGFAEPAIAMGRRLLRIMKTSFTETVYFSGTDTVHELVIPEGIIMQIDELVKTWQPAAHTND